MNYNQHHKQTVDFMARVAIVKQHIFENRDREVTQGELAIELGISRISAQACCENLENSGAIKMKFRSGKRFYYWNKQDTNKLLHQFAAGGKIRERVREFAVRRL